MRYILTFSFICAAFQTCFAQENLSCENLSYRRNEIYKRAGYCFKTAAQIRIFGNSGCSFDDQADVPLSQRDRQIVASIVREERISGCR